ncbi:hypothetical protein FJT64_003292 [Amphibalanus amphitrite]|uniref:Uncharacterized protein n=1 Tax=Amphibalanus amphitrite TaxID=1232801 RepID=A0A6A4WCM5_AMPAM|nr:hypothetical protein FJT64_003292 [Amphibalanus amphitrite]
MRPPEKMNLQCTRDSREKLFARAHTGDAVAITNSLALGRPSDTGTEESEALDEPVSCRAEDAASEDRQFRLTEETEALDNESVSGRTEDAASEDRQFWLGIWLL